MIYAGNCCSAQSLSKDEKERRQKIAAVLNLGPGSGADWKDVLTEYYKGRFDEWIKPDNMANLVNYRRDLIQELKKANNEEAYKFTVDLILGHLDTLAAKGNPSMMVPVRVNAILMIGEINAKGSPLPNPDTIPALVSLLEKENLGDGPRMATLVGLANHARTQNGIDQEALGNAATKSLLDLARGKTPPAQRSADVHEWFRIRAVEVLGGIAGGRPGRMISFMAGIIRDKDSSLPVRIAAAQAMGMLAKQGTAPEEEELPKLLELVAVLGTEAFRAELARHPDLIAENDAGPEPPKPVLPGTGGDAPPGRPVRTPSKAGGKKGPAGAAGKAAPPVTQPGVLDSQVLLFRRSLRSQISAVRLGVWCDSPRAGLRVLVGDDEKKLVGDLNNWFNNVLRATEKTSKDDLFKTLRGANSTLENALRGMKMEGTELFRQLSEIDSILRKAEGIRPG